MVRELEKKEGFHNWLNLDFNKPVEEYTNEELSVVEAVSLFSKWAANMARYDSGKEESKWAEIFEKSHAEYSKRLSKFWKRILGSNDKEMV